MVMVIDYNLLCSLAPVRGANQGWRLGAPLVHHGSGTMLNICTNSPPAPTRTTHSHFLSIFPSFAGDMMSYPLPEIHSHGERAVILLISTRRWHLLSQKFIRTGNGRSYFSFPPTPPRNSFAR